VCDEVGKLQRVELENILDLDIFNLLE
jgi:hypothetical protein